MATTTRTMPPLRAGYGTNGAKNSHGRQYTESSHCPYVSTTKIVGMHFGAIEMEYSASRSA